MIKTDLQMFTEDQSDEPFPVFVYLVQIEYFAGITYSGKIEGRSIQDVWDHPDVQGKIGVMDEIHIKWMGVKR